MEKCKFCQEELPEDVTLCPACGKENKAPAVIDDFPPTAPLTETQDAPAEETPAEEKAEEDIPVEEKAEEEVPAEEKSEEDPAAGESAEEDKEADASQEAKPVTTATPGKIALAIAVIVVLLAVLVALLMSGMNHDAAPSETTLPTDAAVTGTIPPDGNPDDVTCKGSYTVTDDQILAQRDVVVATVGDAKLTNAQLQVYYWMNVQSFLYEYGYYAPYFGLDYTQPLDTQLSWAQDGTTWQQYFLNDALSSWHQIQAMRIEAGKADMDISEDDKTYLEELEASLLSTAQANGITVAELLNVGAGAGVPEFLQYQTDYCMGLPYYNHMVEKTVPTAQDLDDYYTAHESELAAENITRDSRLVNVRHILIFPEGGITAEDGSTTYTDDEWAACEAAAQAVLAAWLAGEATEDTFAALANEKSGDGGSNTNGGLYEGVYVGQMVKEFENWCFDPARVKGDYGLVRTNYGYHIMYFVDSYPQWRDHWISDQLSLFLKQLLTDHPMDVSFEKIALGYAPLN